MKRTVAWFVGLALALAGCDKKPAARAAVGSADPADDQEIDDPAPAPAPDGLRVSRRAPQVGDQVTEVTSQRMNFTAEVAPGQTVDVTQVESTTEISEVLAVDGEVVTKQKVTYATMSESETVAGKTSNIYGPLDGKSYLVWRAGARVKVSRDDGTAASAVEVKAVAKDHQRLGTADPMDAFMAARTWKVGAQVEATADELVALTPVLMSGHAGSHLTHLAMTLRGQDATTATWAIAMAGVLKQDAATLSIDQAGTIKLDVATGDLLELAMTGPFTGFAKVDIKGRITMKIVNTY